MDKTDADDVRIAMSTEEIEKALDDAKMIAFEAMFEADPFDWRAEENFLRALDES